MNREIKFRAWNYTKMIYGCAIRNGLITNHIDSFYQPKQATNYPIMQFTGLQDNKGEEIYDGDILNVLRKGLGVVEWYNYGFIVRLKDEIIWPELFFHVSGNYSIIGNVYENPELKTGL